MTCPWNQNTTIKVTITTMGIAPAAATAATGGRCGSPLSTAGFSIVEAIGGWMSGPLALLSDAGMVTDAAASAVLFADAVARRPPSKRASYGYGRAEVLAAFVNAIAMLAVAAIAIEAARRLFEPVPVAGGTVVVIAIAGAAVNLASAWVLATDRPTRAARCCTSWAICWARSPPWSRAA